jgi:hypothetical protein
MVAFLRRTVSSSSMDVEPIKLFKDLKQAGFHSSVATTYSVDGAFYDGSVQRRLRRFECLNNILIADISMLSRALAATPETFALAGQRYAIVPARVHGCFHPKILLRLGARRARLLVGSANVTAAGWGVNLEIAACFEYRNRDKEGTAGRLVRKAYDYLLRWLEPVQGESIAHKLRLHRRDSAWLVELEANGSPVLLPDGTAADLLCDFGDGKPGIMNRLVELVDGERVRQLVVVSPYWDYDLSALQNLRRAFRMPTTFIGLNPFVSEFPTEAVKKDRSLRFTAVPAEEGNERFLHAKIIIVSSDKADHVVFGSANCTDAALGSVGRGGTNAEMSVYRRLSCGAALPMLGIDVSREVEPSVFGSPTRDPFVGGVGTILAGQVEVTGKVVRWWPPPQVSGEGAALLTGGDERLMLGGGSCLSTLLDLAPGFPMVVRFRLADGRITEPTVVHDCQRLLASAPGVIDGKTMRMFQDVEAGRADLIDLAQRANQLFALGPEPPRGGGGKRREPEAKGTGDYTTSEAFRAALELPRTAGLAGLGPRLVTGDPTLLQLLRIVMRGIVDVPDSSAELAKERESQRDEDKRLFEGEKEDGDENTPNAPEEEEVEAEPSEASAGQEEASKKEASKKKELYTLEDIERRRRYLMKALAKFDILLERFAADTGPVDENLIAQATFIFSLMSVAVTMLHRLESGSWRTLMTFEPTNDSRDSSFVIRAAQMLRTIWVGNGKRPSIAPRIPAWPKNLPPPQDLRVFVVMSRWVMARAHGAVAKGRSNELLGIMGKLTVQVIRATAGFAHVDPMEEERLIRQLEASIGFFPAETDDLLWRMLALREGTPAVPVAAPRRRAANGREAVARLASRR